MEQWQLGASVNLDAIQSLKALWGAASTVINVFSKCDIQLAAVPYMVNCSIVAGESTGWTDSLRIYSAIRSSDGFNLGQLALGYPAKAALPILLESTFGPRWLGILASISFIPVEHAAEDELHRLLTNVANLHTASYILNSEQCAEMWLLGREIFLDSPVQHEYLRIHAKCSTQGFLNCDNISEGQEGFFSSAMICALRIWELAHIDGSNTISRQLVVKGQNGYSVLVFYLTIVCGFKVSVRTDKGELDFGHPASRVHVLVLVNRSSRKGWESGYLVEDLSIKDCVLHVMKPDGSEQWKPGRASFAPSNPVASSLVMQKDSIVDSGEVNLYELQSIKRMIPPAARPYVSLWLANLMHVLVNRVSIVLTDARAHISESEKSNIKHTSAQRRAIAQRLRSGIMVFAPGLLKAENLERLLLNIQKGKADVEPGPLSDTLPMDVGSLICAESCHKGQPTSSKRRRGSSGSSTGSPKKQQAAQDRLTDTKEVAHSSMGLNDEYSSNDSVSDVLDNSSDSIVDLLEGDDDENCEISRLEELLHLLALRLWLCTYMEPTAQTLLRNAGPDSAITNIHTAGSTKVHEALCLVNEDPDLKRVIHTNELVHIVAQALSGRVSQEPERSVLAVTAGGAVVGLNTNDNQSIEGDPGHCIYIIPGSIESPNRRIREVIEPPQVSQVSSNGNEPGISLLKTPKPLNTFEGSQTSHTIYVRGDIAEVETQILSGSRTIMLLNLRAIDNAGHLVLHRKCFKKCAKGRLTKEEISRVHLVTQRNFALGKPTNVMLAHGNTAVQRAFLSTLDGNTAMVSLGQCLHCACKAVLTMGLTMLIT